MFTREIVSRNYDDYDFYTNCSKFVRNWQRGSSQVIFEFDLKQGVRKYKDSDWSSVSWKYDYDFSRLTLVITKCKIIFWTFWDVGVFSFNTQPQKYVAHLFLEQAVIFPLLTDFWMNTYFTGCHNRILELARDIQIRRIVRLSYKNWIRSGT